YVTRSGGNGEIGPVRVAFDASDPERRELPVVARRNAAHHAVRVTAAKAVVLDGGPGTADVRAERKSGPSEDRRGNMDWAEISGHRTHALRTECDAEEKKTFGEDVHHALPQNEPRTPPYMASGIPGRKVRGSLRTKKFGAPKVLLLKPCVSKK